MKRLLVMMLSVALTFGNVGSMTAIAAEPTALLAEDEAENGLTTEITPSDIEGEVVETDSEDELEGESVSLDEEVSETSEEISDGEATEDELSEDESADELINDDMSSSDEESSGIEMISVDETEMIEEELYQEKSTLFDDEPIIHISGEIKASELGRYTYCLDDDTSIVLEDGDDIRVKKFVFYNTYDKLTIKGSNKGTLHLEEPLSCSSEHVVIEAGTFETESITLDGYTASFTISGGTVVTESISFSLYAMLTISGGTLRAEKVDTYYGGITVTDGVLSCGGITSSYGEINISGGSVYTNYIKSFGNVKISGGYTKVRYVEEVEYINYAISARSFEQSGGYLDVYGNKTTISADTVTLSGGISEIICTEFNAIYATYYIKIQGDATVHASSASSVFYTYMSKGEYYGVSVEDVTIIEPAGTIVAEDGRWLEHDGNPVYEVRIEKSDYTYGLITDKEGIGFGTSIMGGDIPETETVTLTNNGTGSIALLDIDTGSYEAYSISNFSSKVLKSGETASFTVQPKEFLKAGNYNTNLEILTSREGVKATIPITFSVEKSDYSIWIKEEAVADFGIQKEGYKLIDEKTFTIVNIGNQSVELVAPETDNYEISGIEGTLGKDEEKTFTIRPKDGHLKGIYNEEIIIRTNKDVSTKLITKFKVEPWNYSIQIEDSVEGFDFGTVASGYEGPPASKTIRIQNIGDAVLKLKQIEEAKEAYVITVSEDEFGPGEYATIAIRPLKDLDPGEYDYLISIKTEQGSEITNGFSLKFRVSKPLSGEYEASELDENIDYVIAGNTTIRLGNTDNVTIGRITGIDGTQASLTITGSDSGVITTGEIAHNGNLIITSGSIKPESVSLESGDIIVSGGSLDSRYNIYAHGNIVVSGGNVIAPSRYDKDAAIICDGNMTISGGNVDCQCSDGSGICSSGKLIISGGTVFTNANMVYGGIFVYGIRCFSSVTIEGNAYVNSFGSFGAISASGQINIGEGLVVSSPVGGYVSEGRIIDPLYGTAYSVVIQKGNYEFSTDVASCSFGKIPVGFIGKIDDKEISFINTGTCSDVISSVTSSDPHFIVANVDSLTGTLLNTGQSASVKLALADGTIDAPGSYTGELSLTTVTGHSYKVPLSVNVFDAGDEIWIDDLPEFTYTGAQIKPVPDVYFGNKKLGSADYTVSYKNNTKAADKDAKTAPSLTITLKGNYSGKTTRTFTIRPASIKGAIAPDITLVYNGKKQLGKTKVTISIGGKTVSLAEKKDFTFEYNGAGDYTKDGRYEVTVKGIGNYAGSSTFNETIVPKTTIFMSKVKVPSIPAQYYAGGKSIVLTGSETYAQTRAKTIKNTEIVDYELVLKNTKNKEMILGKDYRIKKYENNSEIGTASVVLEGMGAYAGERVVTFKISGYALSGATITGFVASKTYTGEAVKQDDVKLHYTKKSGKTTIIDSDLDPGSDYDIDYINNVKTGTATAIFTGKGFFTGTVKKNFKIVGASALTVTLDAESYAYTKGGVKPEPVVTFKNGDMITVLNKGTDYTVKWSNNNAVTTDKIRNQKKLPTVTVTGKGNYKGSKTATFEIKQGVLNEATVTFLAKDVVINTKKAGLYKTPVSITDKATGTKLAAGTDYEKVFKYTYAETGAEVDPKDIIQTPTAINVTVTGKGNYFGNGETAQTYTGSFRFIASADNDISKATITVNKNFAKTYTGETIDLTAEDFADSGITVKLGKAGTPLVFGKDFEIYSIKNNINKGTAKVMIKGLNDYGGTKEFSFKIVAKQIK